MDRHSYLRIHKIDKLIRALPYPDIQRIQKEIGHGSTRTLARDIDVLKDMSNGSLKYSRKHGGYYYSTANFSLEPKNLSRHELVSLLLGYENLKELGLVTVTQNLKSAIDKIVLLSPHELSADAARGTNHYSFGNVSNAVLNKRQIEMFAVLADAIHRRRQAEIKYTRLSDGHCSTRTVEPLHLRFTFGGWYLVAYCRNQKGMRTFFINNIGSVGLLKAASEHVPDFNPHEYFKHSWGIYTAEPTQVRLLFKAHAARYIEDRRWHPSQKTHRHADGSVDFTAMVAGTEEIKRWVLGFGEHVRVLGPASFQQEIKRTALAIKALY